MRTTGEYKVYFQMLATEHPAIKSFVFGDSERIINQERSKLTYPALWLETPDIEETNTGTTFHAAFVVLINSRPEFNREDESLMQAERIMREVIARLREDDLLELPASIRLDNISTMTHDNDYGWRAAFPIVAAHADCIMHCYREQAPIGMIVSFDYENPEDIAENEFDLVVENTSLPDPGDYEAFVWKWSIDGGPVTEEVDVEEPSDVSGTGKFLTIELYGKIDPPEIAGEYEAIARAVIPSGPGCGSSIPHPVRFVPFVPPPPP